MNTYIILLRGVNVGGKNMLPMKELKLHLDDTGFKRVSTYIQSGNVVLQSDKDPESIESLESTIEALIQSKFGFKSEVLVLTEKEFNFAVLNNPYPTYEGKFVHFYFCKAPPKINAPRLAEQASETERYELVDNIFYLHAPDGIGRSKLVAGIESCLGVSATGRNLNTINKLIQMVKNI